MIGYLVMRVVSHWVDLWPVEVVSAFLHLLLLPTIPMLLVAVLIRNQRSVVLLSIGASAYLILFGELFLPRLNSSDLPSELTLMTFNTGNGEAPWEDLERTIRRSGADIVTIQESLSSEVQLYRRDLSELYPYQAFYGSGFHGIGMLSRFPFSQWQLEILPSGRACLVTNFEIDGQPLTVISAHPPVVFGPGARFAPGREDWLRLAQLAAERRPTIVAGDLNVSDQNLAYAEVTSRGLIDAHRKVGFGLGLTYPQRSDVFAMTPAIRIDYILMTSELLPLEAWMGEDGGSDHLPVLARVAWSDESR